MTTALPATCTDDFIVTLTEVPHPPGVTPAPTKPAEDAFLATTSTIYQTVYKDLTEGCPATC